MIEKYNSKLRYLKYRIKYDISPSFLFLGSHTFISKGKLNKKFVVGENSHIGDYGNISLCGGSVFIGNNTFIGHHLIITTDGFDTKEWMNGKCRPVLYGDVFIGNHVWIGHRVFIKGGIKIGDNSVIGYGSIVLKDVPSNCVFVGTKVIKRKSDGEGK